MKHLSDDDIMRLAEITEEELIYSDADLQLMDHLKTCAACYDKFCASLALVQTFSEVGSFALSDIFKMEYANSLIAKAANKVLAVVDLARNRLAEKVCVIMKQVDDLDASLRFHPSLAAAARNMSDSETKLYRFEDAGDDKSYIVYDADINELLIQINTKDLSCSGIRVRLELESGDEIIVNVEKKGKIFTGVIKQIPSDRFRIVIEADD